MRRGQVKWRCPDCKTVTQDSKLLRAPNPFRPEDIITGCPGCRGVVEFDEMCDAEGCNNAASCGWPSEQGYRRTCYQHSTWSGQPQ
jgi:hypothetical protein